MSGITVIIPTLGERRSLYGTLLSLKAQTRHGDCVEVINDGTKGGELNSLVVEFSAMGHTPGVWMAVGGSRKVPRGSYGHSARNVVMDEWRFQEGRPSHDSYLWSLDDDDIALPGALDAIRLAINENHGRWMIFNMIGGANSTFPDRVIPCAGPEIRVGNVGTPCIVWPASAKSRWGTRILEGEYDQRPGYLGDFTFARDLQEELGDPVWVDTVIAEIRP